MARLTVGQKAQRLLAFLLGLGNREIVRALAPYGFDQATLDEGWALLRRAAAVRAGAAPPASPIRAEVERLDAWENRWFPIAAAVLGRHHPEVNAKVFHKLGQTRRKEVVLGVATFLDRVDGLAGSGADAALATLARHGLTGAVLGEARALLGRLMQPSMEQPPGDAADGEPVAGPAPHDAMWSYYRQWSAIARSVISDRRLLRQLGFLRSRRDAGAGEAAGRRGAGAPSCVEDSPGTHGR